VNRLPGFVARDHVVAAPLDHAQPAGETIEVFAREIIAADKADQAADLPWLLYLQGGPGGASPRPTDAGSWFGQALRSHRVLLLDQRGTGRSTPLTAATVGHLSPPDQAAYLRNFRADSIVRDAELVRRQLLGDESWSTLGQSYGGFLTLTYLSLAPEGLRTCYVTGGLPPLTATADEIYERTFLRVAQRHRDYYSRYPGDVEAVARIAEHLDRAEVLLPDGDRLTSRRFRLLGIGFGMSDGLEKVHWLLDTAWHGDRLSEAFCSDVMVATAHVDGPIYALQEFAYAQGEQATEWAAQRQLDRLSEFADDARPLLFTGEMMFPWMFQEIRALQPFAEAAHILAETHDWPVLYDPSRLARNTVPLVAAVYHDDIYVDADFQQATAAAVGASRIWVTNEHEHDGLRASDTVLRRLMEMAAGTR
jgi:pimeloyl-ACP methyl ester carboxylesterase